MESFLFWGLAVIAVAAALGVVLLRSPLNSVMALLAAMCVTAGIYALMGAPLTALFQIIIYTGAVLVLFLFVIMLFDLKGMSPKEILRPGAWVAVMSAVLFTTVVTGSAWHALSLSDPARQSAIFLKAAVSVREIAVDLFTRHLLIFELTSLLLLVAAVGALLISRKGEDLS